MIHTTFLSPAHIDIDAALLLNPGQIDVTLSPDCRVEIMISSAGVAVALRPVAGEDIIASCEATWAELEAGWEDGHDPE